MNQRQQEKISILSTNCKITKSSLFISEKASTVSTSLSNSNTNSILMHPKATTSSKIHASTP
jgi:hypothetical protein